MGLSDAIREAVEINPLNIDEAYIRLPADLAIWNEKYSEALRQYLMAKVDVEETEARLWLTYKARLAESGTKPTEATISSHVMADEQMHAAKIKLIEAEVQKSKTYGIVDAIRAKKDSVVSLGAHIRAELQGDPVLRAQARDYRVLKENR